MGVYPVKPEGLDPPYFCDRCERLRDFIDEHKVLEPTWFNGPVPSFGDAAAKLLILGLAPGLRGANRTGRPFTGDYAGDLLYATLAKFGFSNGKYEQHPGDGLVLQNVLISNAVRCVPPQNKPTTQEIKNCRPFLKNLLAEKKNLKAVLVLGRIAHETLLRTLEMPLKDFPFVHGADYRVNDQLTLYDSYHCSRYNTNTGRLTEAMFEAVFEKISKQIQSD